MAPPAPSGSQTPLLQDEACASYEGGWGISWRAAGRTALLSLCGLGLVAASWGPSLELLRRRAAAFPPASRPQSTAAELVEPCPAEVSAEGQLPWLHIVGGPKPVSRSRHWTPRVCVPKYEGPNCSNTTQWHGKVTLCLAGQAIADVHMATRGHVSEMFPKHQYELTLPRPMGLLGMAPSKKWVVASSYIDTTFQRNPLAFDLYRLLGGWAPSTRFINLRWHGLDFGLYYVGEQPEVSESRIHLPPAKPNSPEESGFLLTADWKKAGVVAVKTANTSTFFNVVHPRAAQVSPGQRSFLQRFLDEVDRRALARSTPPGRGGLEEVLDFPSFARYYIVQELAKDVDGYAFSNFMSLAGGKLSHASPWDFDLAFDFDCTPAYFTSVLTGNVSFGVVGWNVENGRTMGYWTGDDGWGTRVMDFGVNKRQLFLNIWQHAGFAAVFVSSWKAARQGPLADAALRSLVRQRGEVLEASARRDLEIWRSTPRCAFWPCCHPEDSQDFRLATQHLEGYLLGRAQWIDDHVDGLLAK
uniref:Uncharacterized protein n=1 Tax=Alexandrium monilatum TaxID=311494 RepID=A0A6T1LMD6_9DINO